MSQPEGPSGQAVSVAERAGVGGPVLANYGIDALRFVKPVKPGDRISVRIACNSSRRDGDGGYTEKPNFFDVSIYGAPAESVSHYMRKGSRVAVDGRLEWREWETAEQQKRQAVSVVADTIADVESLGLAEPQRRLVYADNARSLLRLP